ALLQSVGFKGIEESILGGINTMVSALVIIVLDWSIRLVTEVLGTCEYVVSVTESWISPSLLPFIVFAIAMFISFATGTSWGTMAILTPIALPLAYNVGGEELIPLAIGSVF